MKWLADKTAYFAYRAKFLPVVFFIIADSIAGRFSAVSDILFRAAIDAPEWCFLLVGFGTWAVALPGAFALSEKICVQLIPPPMR
jgi:hypothetical protein